MIELAENAAEVWHANQIDKGGFSYFSSHIKPVAEFSASRSPRAQVIGYLHDILEDTDIPEYQLEFLFGSDIASCVRILTKAEYSYTRYIQKVIDSGDKDVIWVKICDMYSNLSPGRLILLDDETRNRLVAKYTKHINALHEAYGEK